MHVVYLKGNNMTGQPLDDDVVSSDINRDVFHSPDLPSYEEVIEQARRHDGTRKGARRRRKAISAREKQRAKIIKRAKKKFGDCSEELRQVESFEDTVMILNRLRQVYNACAGAEHQRKMREIANFMIRNNLV